MDLNKTRNHWLLSTICNLILFPSLICILIALTTPYNKDKYFINTLLFIHLLWITIPLSIMLYASYIKRGTVWLRCFLFLNPTFPLGLLLFFTGDALWKLSFGISLIAVNLWWYRSSFRLIKGNNAFVKNELLEKHRLGKSLSQFECLTIIQNSDTTEELDNFYTDILATYSNNIDQISHEYRLRKMSLK